MRAASAAQAALISTESEFLVETTLKAFDGGKPFLVRRWLQCIPRNSV